MKKISIEHAAWIMGRKTEQMEDWLEQAGVRVPDGLLDGEALAALMQYLEGCWLEQVRQAQSRMAWLCERYTMMIDTCSLLHPQFPTFAEHVGPMLHRRGKALNIPSGIWQELLSLHARKPALKETIQTVFGILHHLHAEGLVRIWGDSGTGFGDQELLTAAMQLMTNCELLVITQDCHLSADLLQLNRLDSVRGKGLGVSRINRYGYLSRYVPQEERFAESRSVEDEVMMDASALGERIAHLV